MSYTDPSMSSPLAAIHEQEIETARQQHLRIRELALRAFEDHKAQQEQQDLKKAARKERRRIEKEQESVRLQAELDKLKATKVVAPPRAKTTPPPPAPEAKKKALEPKLDEKAPEPKVEKNVSEPKVEQKAPEPAPKPAAAPAPPAPAPLSPKQSATQVKPAETTEKAKTGPVPTVDHKGPPGVSSVLQNGTAGALADDNDTSHFLPGTARYLDIHRELKNLRHDCVKYAKRNHEFKVMMGEMRRTIRKCVGQIKERGNEQQVDEIRKILLTSLYRNPGPCIDPNDFVVEPRAPVEGSPCDSMIGEELPALFLYLLNVFSKCIVAQLVSEASVKLKAAEPIGIVAVTIFSFPGFLWRGKSLIDIMIAKFRANCPVLFGIRGTDKTEEGRQRLGWRFKKGDTWVSEPKHFDRMTGLAAGYGAISLRDFSRSPSKQNPYPPSMYWQSVAAIVNTPDNQISGTQSIVIRALVECHEDRFLKFYGLAAKAALREAVVSFTVRAAIGSAAGALLIALAPKLAKDSGLILDPNFVPLANGTASGSQAPAANPLAQSNAFGGQQQTNTFGGQQTNAFGQPMQQQQATAHSFGGAQQQQPNPFGAPQQQPQPANPFGGAQQMQSQQNPNPFGGAQQMQAQQNPSPFNAPQQPQQFSNPFSGAQQMQAQQNSNAFGAPQQQPQPGNPFGGAQQMQQPTPFGVASQVQQNPFGAYRG